MNTSNASIRKHGVAIGGVLIALFIVFEGGWLVSLIGSIFGQSSAITQGVQSLVSGIGKIVDFAIGAALVVVGIILLPEEALIFAAVGLIAAGLLVFNYLFNWFPTLNIFGNLGQNAGSFSGGGSSWDTGLSSGSGAAGPVSGPAYGSGDAGPVSGPAFGGNSDGVGNSPYSDPVGDAAGEGGPD